MAAPCCVRQVCLFVVMLAAVAKAETTPGEDDTSLSLVQLSLHTGKKLSKRDAIVGALMADLDLFVFSGALSRGSPPTAECGRARYQDLTMSLKVWREQHPNENGFCYFQNLAWWFMGYDGNVSDYRAGMPEAVEDFVDNICKNGKAHGGLVARGTGPSVSMNYDGGNLTWAHLDTCIDLGDDPYCHSLGWLKGQRLDGRLRSDPAAWEALARSECARIQQTYHFLDEEVTVGNHIFNTAVYLRGAGCAILGNCPAVTSRLHNQHAYTKCLLGGSRAAATEMSYCYYKGCVMADGRIGHQAECNYD